MPAKKAAKKAAKESAEKIPAKKAAKKAVKKTAAKAAAPKSAPPPATGKSGHSVEVAAYLNYRSRIEKGLPGDHIGDWLAAEKMPDV
jgi:hypothetical protein